MKFFLFSKNTTIYLSVIVAILAIIILYLLFQNVSEPITNPKTFHILNELNNSISNPFFNNTFLSDRISAQSRIYTIENISEVDILNYLKAKYSLSEQELNSGYLSKAIADNSNLTVSNETINLSYTQINNSTIIDPNSIQINIINYLHNLGNETNYSYLKKIELSDLYFRYTYMSIKDEAVLVPKDSANTVYVELFPVASSGEDRIILSNKFEPIFSFLSTGNGGIMSVSTKNILHEYHIKDYVKVPNNIIGSNIFKFNYVYDLNSDYGVTSIGKYNITGTDLSSLDTIYLINSNNEAIPFVIGTFTDSSGLEYRFGFDIIQGLK